MKQNIFFKTLILPALALVLALPAFAKDKAPAKTAEKPKIAVLALEAKNIPAVYADIVRDILEVNLHKQGSFAVLERSQINLIMKEQKTTLNQCSETQCAVDYGKVLSADMVVVGSISRLTEYNIAVKLVDIRESRIIAAEFEQVPSDKELDRAVNSLAGRISAAAIKDTGYVPEPQDDDRHPVYFGIAYRYGMCFGFPIPVVGLPDNYGDPLKIKAGRKNASIMGVTLNIDFGFNRYFSVKSNATAYFLGERPHFYVSKTGLLGADSVEVTSSNSGRHYHGLGLDILGKASYPFKRIIPYAALGGGYAYFTQEIVWTQHYITSSSGSSSVPIEYSKKINLFFINAEAGITFLIQDSIGFTLSGIYSHALKQQFHQKPEYKSNHSSGTLPAIYQPLTKDSFTQVDTLDLPPFYYIQAGFVFRFM